MMADPNPPWWWIIMTLPIALFLWGCLWVVESINWLLGRMK